MTQLQLLRDWGVWASGTAFWTCLTWPAVVRLFWPWHKDAWGWNMVIKTELLALALLASTLRYEFGVTSRYALLWVTVFAISAIPPVVAWRTWLIWRGQRSGPPDDRKLRPASFALTPTSRCRKLAPEGYEGEEGPLRRSLFFASPGSSIVASTLSCRAASSSPACARSVSSSTAVVTRSSAGRQSNGRLR